MYVDEKRWGAATLRHGPVTLPGLTRVLTLSAPQRERKRSQPCFCNLGTAVRRRFLAAFLAVVADMCLLVLEGGPAYPARCFSSHAGDSSVSNDAGVAFDLRSARACVEARRGPSWTDQ